MTAKAAVSHDECMVKSLRRDRAFAIEYLKAAAEDLEPRVFLIALRHLVLARGIGRVARAAHIERQSLSRALLPRGNPRLTTLMAVMKALGLTLTVERAKSA